MSRRVLQRWRSRRRRIINELAQVLKNTMHPISTSAHMYLLFGQPIIINPQIVGFIRVVLVSIMPRQFLERDNQIARQDVIVARKIVSGKGSPTATGNGGRSKVNAARRRCCCCCHDINRYGNNVQSHKGVLSPHVLFWSSRNGSEESSKDIRAKKK